MHQHLDDATVERRPPPRRAPGRALALALLAAAPATLLPPRLDAWPRLGLATPAQATPLDRVQMHRNPNRSVPYLPLARAGAPAGSGRLAMRPVRTIELDGDPLQNVYSNLRPIDVDGNGSYEFLQFNGYRFMQAWDGSGRKLWRVEVPGGRLHPYDTGTHRDTLAVLDVDGDGRQDVAHCWVQGGRKTLVLRRGTDGSVIRSVPLDGGANEPCQMAAFHLADTRQTVLLVAQEFKGSPACRGNNFVESWSRTVAFDLRLRKLWDTRTCDAGHYVYPIDANYDGFAEGVFVGKYRLRGNGTIQCVLDTWPLADHTDGVALADLDPRNPGLEAVAVGLSGMAAYDAETCRETWRIPLSVVRDPQHLALAKLDPNSPTPLVTVDERGSVRGARTFVIDGRGRIVSAARNGFMPMQNANLDGALGVDEAVGGFGAVTDRSGAVRLDKLWYWNLRGGRVRETRRGPYPRDYDRWQAFPLVFDYDRDGRDEIVQWGQSAIVVGKVN